MPCTASVRSGSVSMRSVRPTMPLRFCHVCCADFTEVQRRFRIREGHETEPEREASDLSVFWDIRRRWESPLEDQPSEAARARHCDLRHAEWRYENAGPG